MKLYLDTVKFRFDSLCGNIYFQIYADEMKGQCILSSQDRVWSVYYLHDFVHDLGGIPDVLVSDSTTDEMESEFAYEARHYRIKQQGTTCYSPWKSRMEHDVGDLMSGIKILYS